VLTNDTPSIHRNRATDVHPVRITLDTLALPGELALPSRPHGVVIFAHGSGSSRHSPRNQFVAQALNEAGFATLLFDLLTPSEEATDTPDCHLRFDIRLLAGRLESATRWIVEQPATHALPRGYFGASTGGAAALVAAAELGEAISAVVCRGGRPDLAGPALGRVVAPTRFIVGERDTTVLQLNRQALTELQCVSDLAVVPGASHLFEEPGKLAEAATLATAWFRQYLRKSSRRHA